MGLRYLASDSSGMKNNLKRNLQQGNQVIADLKAGSQHLVNAIDGHTLSGAAYTAGKGLFTDLIIPVISNVAKALENVQTDLTKYESQEAIVSGESLLDEDRLNAERKIKSQLRDSAKNRAESFNQTAKAIEHVPILEIGSGMFKSMSKEMESLAKSYQDEITKIDKKLTKLHKFSTGIQGLFQNSLQELNSAMKSVTSLNSVVVDSKKGSYKISPKTPSFTQQVLNNLPESVLSSHTGYIKGNIISSFEKFAKSKSGERLSKFPIIGTGIDVYNLSQDKKNSSTDIILKASGHLVINTAIDEGLSFAGAIFTGLTTGGEGAAGGTLVEPGGGTIVGGIGGVAVGAVGGSVAGFTTGLVISTKVNSDFDDFYENYIRKLVNKK